MKLSDVLSLLKENKTAEMQILIEETLGISKTYMLTHPEAEIDKAKWDELIEKMAQLKEGRPLQYILGFWEFLGRKFLVGEGVLIPREDTGAVAELAQDFLNQRDEAVFADLGSGSGCIAVTLSLSSGAKGYSVERSQEAFYYLEKNLKQAENKVEAVLGDMFSKEVLEKLPQLDLVVSNPPYITGEEMQELSENVKREPREALFGGEDGLDYYRKITEIYKNKLKEGGMLCFEVGFEQADAVLEILKKEGFHSPKEKKDFNGIRRAVSAIK